jgi:hypothetical protein
MLEYMEYPSCTIACYSSLPCHDIPIDVSFSFHSWCGYQEREPITVSVRFIFAFEALLYVFRMSISIRNSCNHLRSSVI